METRDTSPTKKALQINLDDSIYGTFAEIGAGQEVARHFFQAGKASQTIAKSISAYDMTFSDQIYGKENRYVCEPRLMKMLDYEFSLLQERLQAQRGSNSRFFAFADTVATSNQEIAGAGKCHGWMGIRFQTKPGGPANDIILHVKMWDRFRLQQQDALGVLGVNLIHSAFFPPEEAAERIGMLLDSLSPMRIEVNMIRFRGPDLAHLDNRLMSLELVRQHLTEAILFGQNGEVQHASDALFKQALFVQRGTFRPITKNNLQILNKGLEQFRGHPLCKGLDPKVLLEITMHNLMHESGGSLDQEDFLHRVDTLGTLGHQVLISNFKLFYQMKSYLRQCTDQLIGIVVGASHLDKMFEKSHYEQLPGGILEGMSRLFDEKTRLFSFPFKSKDVCMTSKNFHPSKDLEHLYQYLLANDLITDILDCDDVDTSIHSRDVRKMLESGDAKWKTLVPEKVRDLIEQRQLFGFKPR